MEYHTIYKGPEGESTEWEDLQRKIGNLPAKEPTWKPDPYSAPEENYGPQAAYSKLQEMQEVEEVEELEDEFVDDRFLEKYRQQRMEELKKNHHRQGSKRFGSIECIRRNEFIAQVTNAGEGLWVVCHLHKDSVQDSCILDMCLVELAKRYPTTKFVRITSTECIPNYPDENVPTVLLYKDTKCIASLARLAAFGGHSTSPELVALTLNRYGNVCGDADETTEQIKAVLTNLIDKTDVTKRYGDDDDDE